MIRKVMSMSFPSGPERCNSKVPHGIDPSKSAHPKSMFAIANTFAKN
jgi:hypothetical protein